jgi:hypothetical protein
VELRLSENVLCVLQAESQAAAERADANSGGISLIVGNVLIMADSSRMSGYQKWDIKTPAAAVAIRGTELAVHFSPPQGTRVAVWEGDIEMQAAETAQGENKPIRVAANQEGVAARGKPLQVLPKFSATMRPWFEKRADLRRRMQRMQQGWSYWNPQDRAGLRKQRVEPPPKVKPRKPRPLLLRTDGRKGTGL